MKTIQSRSRWLGAAAGALLLLGLATAIGAYGDQLGPLPVENSQLPTNATISACKARGEIICNPAAHATFVATQPLARPVLSTTHLISKADAQIAALQVPMTTTGPAAPVNSPILSRMMTRPEMEKLMPNMGHSNTIDSNRPVWVVTVHADMSDSRGLRTYHTYTVVIDAATGQVTDVCAGCTGLG